MLIQQCNENIETNGYINNCKIKDKHKKLFKQYSDILTSNLKVVSSILPSGRKNSKIYFERDRTRTCNPQIRSLVPYPLGHTPLLLVTYSSMKQKYLLLKGKIFQHWLKCSNTHISTYLNIEQSVLIHDSSESDQVEEYY